MIWVVIFGTFLIGGGLGAIAMYVLLSQNIPGHGAHTGPMLALNDDPPGAVADTARSRPPRVENEAATGSAPGLSGPGASRFACCPCCYEDSGRCDPPDSHLAPCDSGCNDAPADVPPHPRFGAAVGDTPPDGIEVVKPDGVLTVGGLPVTRHRPVNGRSLGDQPRRNKQPWFTSEMPAVPASEEPADAPDPERWADPPVPIARPYSPQALNAEQVEELRTASARGYLEACKAATGEVTEQDMRDALDSLRHLPTYGQAPVATVLEGERLASRMQQ